MKLDLFNINNFIKLNDIKEVSNPIFFESGFFPTIDGLFSLSIFGAQGSYDRKTIFGYINLNGKFIHPVIYKLLNRLDSRIDKIINGTLKVSLDSNGYIIDDEENGETGLKFLYNSFKSKKIKFKETESGIRDTRISVLKNALIDEMFIDTFLVIPAFYRDYSLAKSSSGKPEVDEINNLYSQLINYATSLQDNQMFQFMNHLTISKMQKILEEIYTVLTGSLSKKNGIIRKSLLGKSTDYSVRAVISAPNMVAESWSSLKIPFGYTEVPLAMLINLFFPFYIFFIQRYLEEKFNSELYIRKMSQDVKANLGKVDNIAGSNLVMTLTGNTIKEEIIELDNPMYDYTPEKIKKLLGLFIKSPQERTMPLTVNTKTGKRMIGIRKNGKAVPLTLVDLVFIVSEKIIRDKHIYITRYPITAYTSLIPSKIKILSTYKTEKVEIDSTFFENYPSFVGEGPDIESQFIDSLRMHNGLLSALGGDYDGDMVSVRGCFSAEANIEAEKIINSKLNVLDLSTNLMRSIDHEAIQSLYALTLE